MGKTCNRHKVQWGAPELLDDGYLARSNFQVTANRLQSFFEIFERTCRKTHAGHLWWFLASPWDTIGYCISVQLDHVYVLVEDTVQVVVSQLIDSHYFGLLVHANHEPSGCTKVLDQSIGQSRHVCSLPGQWENEMPQSLHDLGDEGAHCRYK